MKTSARCIGTALGSIAIATSLVLGLVACSAAKEESPKDGVQEEDAAQVVPAPTTVAGRYEADSNAMLPLFDYALVGVHEVNGRQGVAASEGAFYVSGSTTPRLWQLSS